MKMQVCGRVRASYAAWPSVSSASSASEPRVLLACAPRGASRAQLRVVRAGRWAGAWLVGGVCQGGRPGLPPIPAQISLAVTPQHAWAVLASTEAKVRIESIRMEKEEMKLTRM